MRKSHDERSGRLLWAALLVIGGVIVCGVGLLGQGLPALFTTVAGMAMLVAGALVAEEQP